MTKTDYNKMHDKLAKFDEISRITRYLDQVIKDLTNNTGCFTEDYVKIITRHAEITCCLTEPHLTEFINWLKAYQTSLLKEIDEL